MSVAVLPKIHRIRICKNKFNFLYPQRSLKGLTLMFCVSFKTSGEDNEKLILATVFAAVATTAIAGGMSEPVMEAPVVASIMDGAAGSASLLLISLALIAIVALATNLLLVCKHQLKKDCCFNGPFSIKSILAGFLKSHCSGCQYVPCCHSSRGYM